MSQDGETIQWVEEQIALYSERRPSYVLMADVLTKILQGAVERHAPLAIVQARAKGVPNFAEKAFRKQSKYRQPADQFTDLCGARVIVTTEDEMRAICGFLKSHFVVDEEEDTTVRLAASEFGYRSVHFIVSFKPGVFPTDGIPVEVPEELFEMPNARAEIQVRTLLQHAWSNVVHDLVYKAGCEVPALWRREIARVAAMLEAADAALAACVRGLSVYAASYGAYMDSEAIERELQVLYFVKERDPGNVVLAKRIAGLEKARCRWEAVVAALEPFAEANDPVVLRELGVALCEMSGGDPATAERGRRLLEAAASEPYRDAQALSELGVRWRGIDEEAAQACFREAFALAPEDPYVLENHLVYEIATTRSVAALTAAEPAIQAALRVCRERSAVGVDLPRSRFTAAKLELLLGRPLEALKEAASGVACATTRDQISTVLESVERLRPVRAELKGWEWLRRLLLLGLAGRFCSEESLSRVRSLATKGVQPMRTPVSMIAGTCDPLRAEQVERYRPVVVEGFHRYQGTLVGGGTREGVSGFVGDIAERYGKVRSIAYLPKKLPFDATRDERYSELRVIDDEDFTPLGPLQAWTDLIAAGVRPGDVVLLGIEGGPIAAVEYRIALALGATVAVFEDGGRAAAEIEEGTSWGETGRFVRLPVDAHAVTALLECGYTEFDQDTRERLGRIVHDRYRAKRLSRPGEIEHSLEDWESLDEGLKESNRRQADDMLVKLDELGFSVEKVPEGESIEPIMFTPDEIERLAVMEHARWVVERLMEGWRYGPEKDVKRKISPHLVEWERLREDVRQFDREAVAAIPEVLASVGLRVRRKAGT